MCKSCNCPEDKLCWQGYKELKCPKRSLENQRLLYGAIIVVLVTLLVLITK